jgi:hypothetical protein
MGNMIRSSHHDVRIEGEKAFTKQFFISIFFFP